MPKSGLRRHFLGGLAGAGSAAAAPAPAAPISPRSVFPVREFGAVADGVRLDTAAIQKAIDACSARGGGAVQLTPGRYLSSTIVLKNDVTLQLEHGAVLLGSARLADYPSHVAAFRSYTDNYTEKSLIYAENARNIGITGPGVVDGQGKAFEGPYKVRPYLIRLIECRNVSAIDVRLENSPMWVLHLLACDNVNVRGVRIHSRVNHNNDGIDVDCCQRVRISDCDIFSGDDSIVLKSTADRITRDVVVTNCILSTPCNAFKLGTESNGGFQNIAMSNCTIYDTGTSGIELDMVDGGLLDGVVVSNVAMRNVGSPIFMRLGNRARPFREGGPRPGMGKLRNVLISNVQATGAGIRGCGLAGLPGHCIENVTLENIRLHFVGGGKKQEREVPEYPDKYPASHMFGTMPSFGFFCRHVRGLRMRNVELTTEKPDERPPVIMDDVTGPNPAIVTEYS